MKLPLSGSIKGMVIFIVTLSLLPALGLLIFSGYSTTQATLKRTDENALVSVKNIARQQAMLVENTRALLVTLSHIKEIQNKDAKAATVLFTNMLLHTPVYTDIRLCDINGRTIASATSDPITEIEHEQVTRAAKGKSFYIEALPVSSEHSGAILNCLYPVYPQKGDPYVLVASIKITIPETEIKSLEARRIESLHLVDKQGTTLQVFSADTSETQLHKSNKCDVWRSIAPIADPFGVVVDENGQRSVYEKLSRKKTSTPYLTIVLHLSTAAIYKEMQGQIISNVSMLLGATILALIITWYLCSFTLLAPVKRLLSVATRLKRGDLTARIESPPSVQELRILSKAFNTMSISLETRDTELLTARDAANSASQSKSDFLANMSHEIRTPMNAILGMTYLTKNSDLTPQQQGYLDKIHTEASNLLVIINDILDFSKIEAGKVHIEKIHFSPVETLRDILTPVAAEIEAKKLQFSSILDSRIPASLIGDPLHFSQVIKNFLSNAVKYTQQGFISFSCTLSKKTADTAELVCIIADSGRGMDATQLKQYFSETENAPEQKSFSGSSGLNVTITRRLIALMNGSLQVDSSLGKGTTITMLFPFAMPAKTSMCQDDESSDECIDQSLTDSTTNAVSITEAKLLLVEDNIINQQIAEEILTSAGATVHTANNGVEALEQLQAMPDDAPYHIILMDLQMPELDGFATTRRIREDARIAHIPVIAMTAHTLSDEWESCHEAGMDDYISKPIDVPVLFATLKKWLGKGKHTPR